MKPAVSVQVQYVSGASPVPDRNTIADWICHAFSIARPDNDSTFEMAVRIVDQDESRALNYQFRHADKATNVLAFPCGDVEYAALRDEAIPLGDLVICGPIVLSEALEQQKTADSHWFHLLVHGTLHLLGYDHEQEQDAAEMEALEARILVARGVPDPYRDQ